MARRRHLLRGLAIGAPLGLTLPRPARAQAPRRARVAILSPGQLSIDFFRQEMLPELARAGYVEGRTLEIIARSAEGDPARVPALAAELLAARPDVVVAVSNPVAQAIRAIDPGMPIVMGFAGSDPVADGLARSLAQPGGMVTGIVMLAEELDLKRVELAQRIFPDGRRFGFLAGASYLPSRVERIEAAARGLGIDLVTIRAGGPESFAPAFAAFRARDVTAVVIGSFPGFSSQAADLARRALADRLPTICEWRFMAEAGCALSQGPINAELRRRVAGYVLRILRGEPPGQIPMERADRFELVVNQRTLRTLGLELPALVLAQADEVIE